MWKRPVTYTFQITVTCPASVSAEFVARQLGVALGDEWGSWALGAFTPVAPDARERSQS